MKIRNKLFLGILVVLLFPTLGGFIALRQLERGLKDTVGENTTTAAASLADEVESRVYRIVDLVRELAETTPELNAALESSNLRFRALGNRGAIDSYLAAQDEAWRRWMLHPESSARPPIVDRLEKNLVSELLGNKLAFWRSRDGGAIFGEIFATNEFGANVAQTGVTSDFNQSDETWWLATAENGLWLGEVEFDESAQVNSLNIAVRVADGDRLLGVLKAAVNIGEVHRVLEDYEMSAALLGGIVELRDRNGRMLFPEYEGDSGTDLEEDAGRDRFWIEKGSEGVPDALRAAATTRGDARLPDLGWTVILSFPTDTLFAAIGRVQRQAVTVGLIAFLLAVLTAVGVSFTVSGPIRSAVALADRIAEGDLTVGIQPRGGGEVRELLEAASAMVTRLRGIVTGIVGASDQVSGLSDALTEMGVEISSGATRQSSATDDSRASVERMARSIETVADSVRNVNNEIVKAAASVEEMSASNATVVKNTDDLAATVSANLEMVHELAVSIDQAASSAAAAGEASEKAVRQARDGGTAVRLAAQGAKEISETMGQIADVNESLAGSSARIDYATEIIEGIAKKTKLLALNATLQAANAGEHGRAFHTIAVEITNLAERSAKSATEIAELIDGVRQAILEADGISRVGSTRAQEGVALAENAGRALDQVVDTIQSVSAGMLQISGATSEQAASSSHLVKTFEQMRQMTDEVANATRGQQIGGQQILRAMGRLRTIIEKVAGAVRIHGRNGEQVQDSIVSIAAISERNVGNSAQIVDITERLRHQATAVRTLGEFFALTTPGDEERKDLRAAGGSR